MKMSLDDWLIESYELRQKKRHCYYCNDYLGTPKYENGLDVLWKHGYTPLEALEKWERYKPGDKLEMQNDG
tara:strand:- start:526 stop:738 length:213 start_codon:yes stop_codon:yes gene_type:complete